MTSATLTPPAEPTTGSLPSTMSVAPHDLGSRPDDAPQADDIDKLDEVGRRTRKASTTAGVGLLAMSVLSAFGYLLARRARRA